MKITNYKNKHSGESCIILASGPSLKEVKNEDFRGLSTFVCNDAFLRAYSAPYWVTGDPTVLHLFRALNQQTSKLLAPEIFTTMGGDEQGITYLDRKSVPNADSPFTHKKYPFSFDLEDEIYESSDTAHLALHVAVWMGFTTIHLFGVEYRYTKDRTHFYGWQKGHEESGLDKYADKIKVMTDTATLLEHNGIKVYNCSRDSKLKDLRFKEIKDAIHFLRKELW